MTKQNVIVQEASAAMSSPTYLPTHPVGDSSLTIRKIYPSRLELGSRPKVNPLMESMRASSPTHTKMAALASIAAASSSTKDDHGAWMIEIPSALNEFEHIMSMSVGKQIVMFLDYDGTLSPIVDDPDSAFISEDMRAAVKAVAMYFPTAIVSGRSRDKVFDFVQLSELYYAGSHGMDIKGPESCPKYSKSKPKDVLFQPASEFLPMIDEVYNTLLEQTKSISGAKVENNKFCVSVHYRCVEENGWAEIAEQVQMVINEYPKLKLTQGRKVIEIRPNIMWDKGKALEFLLESLGFADCEDLLPIYIGDDRTDEDAFKVLRNMGQGFGILVSKFPKETYASYSLQEPAEVMDFLLRLYKWKCLCS